MMVGKEIKIEVVEQNQMKQLEAHFTTYPSDSSINKLNGFNYSHNSFWDIGRISVVHFHNFPPPFIYHFIRDPNTRIFTSLRSTPRPPIFVFIEINHHLARWVPFKIIQDCTTEGCPSNHQFSSSFYLLLEVAHHFFKIWGCKDT